MGAATFYGGGGGQVFISRTAFASPLGSDLTGKAERLDKPFKTIAAAQASLGALTPTLYNRVKVVAMPNLWLNEDIILQNYTDFELHGNFIKTIGAGALITDDGATADSFVNAIDANFIVDAPGETSLLIRLFNVNSNVTIIANNFEVIESLTSYAIWCNGAKLTLTFNNITTDNHLVLIVDNFTSNVIIRCNKMENLNGGGGVISVTSLGVKVFIYANQLLSSGTNAGNVIFVEQQAQVKIYASIITAVANNNLAVLNEKGGFCSVYNSVITAQVPANNRGVIYGASEAGGLLIISNCRVINTFVNGNGVYIAEVNTILDNVTIITAAAGRSIAKLMPPILPVLLYGQCQGVAINSVNVLPTVGVFISNVAVK